MIPRGHSLMRRGRGGGHARHAGGRAALGADGRTLGGVSEIERTAVSPDVVRIVLEERGIDGNDRKSATFRHVLLLGARSFSLTKLVRFDGSAEFFERNSYVLAR